MSYELAGFTDAYLTELQETQKLSIASVVLADNIERIYSTGELYHSEVALVTKNLSNTFGIRVAPLVGDYARHTRDDWTEASVDCSIEVERNDGWRRCALHVTGTSIMGQAIKLRYVLNLDDANALLPNSGVYVATSANDTDGKPKWVDTHTILTLSDVKEAGAILAELYPFAH